MGYLVILFFCILNCATARLSRHILWNHLSTSQILDRLPEYDFEWIMKTNKLIIRPKVIITLNRSINFLQWIILVNRIFSINFFSSIVYLVFLEYTNPIILLISINLCTALQYVKKCETTFICKIFILLLEQKYVWHTLKVVQFNLI